jgi:hypothetical protein
VITDFTLDCFEDELVKIAVASRGARMALGVGRSGAKEVVPTPPAAASAGGWTNPFSRESRSRVSAAKQQRQKQLVEEWQAQRASQRPQPQVQPDPAAFVGGRRRPTAGPFQMAQGAAERLGEFRQALWHRLRGTQPVAPQRTVGGDPEFGWMAGL